MRKALRASLPKLLLARYIQKHLTESHQENGQPMPQSSQPTPAGQWTFKRKTLKIVTWNIQGLTQNQAGEGQPGKLAELTRYMAKHNIDVLLLQGQKTAGIGGARRLQAETHTVCSGRAKQEELGPFNGCGRCQTGRVEGHQPTVFPGEPDPLHGTAERPQDETSMDGRVFGARHDV